LARPPLWSPSPFVDLPAEQLTQLELHRGEGEQPGHVTGLELHQDIDVAVVPKVVPERGTEDR
jgi:hypothetical protein